MTGIGRSKLYELIASGDVETIKIGRRTLVKVDLVYALKQEKAASKAGQTADRLLRLDLNRSFIVQSEHVLQP
nr:hypothetical protein [Novosphingobium sp. ERN07]